jgi:hypothetical protein
MTMSRLLQCLAALFFLDMLAVTGFTTKQLASSEELRQIAHKSARKIPFSQSSLKTWRLWSETFLQHIRSDLLLQLAVPVNHTALRDLSSSLGIAADTGFMPSFADESARAGYAVEYFCRAQLAADLLFGSAEPAFLVQAVQNLLSSSDSCRLTSLGGGPGFDFVAAVLTATYKSQQKEQQPTRIQAIVLDYELGWAPLVHAMGRSVHSILGGPHTCDFGGCDITLPLADPSNRQAADRASDTNVWICSYCVAENAAKLRHDDYVFFRDLFAASQQGAFFVFTETTHRIWPELAQAAMAEATGFDIAFPRREDGRGKRGRQMVLQKRLGATMGEIEKELCILFQGNNELHERKIRNGSRRQVRKIRGGK